MAAAATFVAGLDLVVSAETVGEQAAAGFDRKALALVASHAHNHFVDALFELRKSVAFNSAWLWDSVAMPLLFAMTGTTMNVPLLFAPSVLAKVAAPLLVGALARICSAALIVRLGSNSTWAEAFFCGMAWAAKGSVQSAYASIGRKAIVNAGVSTSVAAAATALHFLSLLSALLFAPLVSCFIGVAGPRLLRHPAVAQ